MLTYNYRYAGFNSKPIFSDWNTLKTLDVVFMLENDKNECSQRVVVNITKLT